MSEKTIKVDEAVHDELVRLKAKHQADTFNGLLRRELGLAPGTDLDKLTSFFPEKLREATYTIVEEIETTGDVDRRYTEDEYSNYLVFEACETGRKIADIEFDEDYFKVRYRDNSGEMNHCGTGRHYSSGSIKYGKNSSTYDHIELEDVVDHVSHKVRGSYRRWSQE